MENLLKRTDYCGALRLADDQRQVALYGWVARNRDHGGIIFIDLRDREGIVQIVIDPESCDFHDRENSLWFPSEEVR